MRDTEKLSVLARIWRWSCLTLGWILVAWIAVQLGLQVFRNMDIAQVCGRNFERSSTLSAAEVSAQYGTLHKVGKSRRDESLFAGPSWWSEGCEGPAPGALFSRRSSTEWVLWGLRGGV